MSIQDPKTQPLNDFSKDIAGNDQRKIEVYEIEIEVTSMPYKDMTDLTKSNSSMDFDNFKNKTIEKITSLPPTTILMISASVIFALLFLCCITLLLMKRWKNKYYNCMQKGFDGCDPNCGGSKRPLLRRDRSAETLSRTSDSSRRE